MPHVADAPGRHVAVLSMRDQAPLFPDDRARRRGGSDDNRKGRNLRGPQAARRLKLLYRLSQVRFLAGDGFPYA